MSVGMFNIVSVMKKQIKKTIEHYDKNRYFHSSDFDWIMKKNIELINNKTDETKRKNNRTR